MTNGHLTNKIQSLFPKIPLPATAVFLLTLGVMGFALSEKSDPEIKLTKSKDVEKDGIESIKAFAVVYKTLTSARCMNCHPAGNIPLQGDDNHLHIMAPRRGTDGKGLYAMKCANCHQPVNTPGLHTPPGNPKWGLRLPK